MNALIKNNVDAQKHGIPGFESASFFVGIIYTGDITQLIGTVNSVLKQVDLGLTVHSYIFCPAIRENDLSIIKDVTIIAYSDGADFFKKIISAITDSQAKYCMVLKSGEEIFESAFISAANIFDQQPAINWLTGIQTLKTESGFNIALSSTAARRWNYNIYERNLYKNSGRYIAPGATFWRKEIWSQVVSHLHFINEQDFCEDIWLAFLKTQKLYTCKVYFSTTANYGQQQEGEFKKPNSFVAVEDGLWPRIKEFVFVNNIPYLRFFYRKESALASVVRFDHNTQTYFLSEY